MITKAIEKAFQVARQRQWERTFWAFDIHDTILKSNYSHTDLPSEFYPYAKEAMQEISSRGDIVRILFTCSHETHLNEYLTFFKSYGIIFDHVNSNPDIPNTMYGNYDVKPYFNVLFDDKAGFDPMEDWKHVIEALKKFPLLSV